MSYPRMVPITEVKPGDVIDLEDVDIDPSNVWMDELAAVESVSTRAARSGGWCDGYLDSPDGASIAIVYTDNGSVPSIVPITATVSLEGHTDAYDTEVTP